MQFLPMIRVCSNCTEPLPCRCVREMGMNPKPMERWRSESYLKFVRGLPCSVPDCQQASRVEAAHFGPRAAGRKVHDCLAIPLCQDHHRDSHQKGRAWEYYDEVMGWQIQTMLSFMIREQ